MKLIEAYFYWTDRLVRRIARGLRTLGFVVAGMLWMGGGMVAALGFFSGHAWICFIGLGVAGLGGGALNLVGMIDARRRFWRPWVERGQADAMRRDPLDRLAIMLEERARP